MLVNLTKMPSSFSRQWRNFTNLTCLAILLFTACSAAVVPGRSSSTPSKTTSAPQVSTTSAGHGAKPGAARPVDFSSAVRVAASVSAELAQVSNVPVIPIPRNASHMPEYGGIARLAQALQIVQAGIASSETEDFVAKLVAHSNTTGPATTLSGRDATIRIMIAGDSISQGQVGDHTWRYR